MNKTAKKPKSIKEIEIKAKYRNRVLPSMLILDLRDKTGLSFTDLSLLLGLCHTQVYDIASEKYNPSLRTRAKLFKLYSKMMRAMAGGLSEIISMDAEEGEQE